jgi:twinkle protein
LGRDLSEDNLAVYDDGHKYCFACAHFEGTDTTNEQFTYEYLPWRGISKETMAFYDAKTKVAADGKPVSIGFKYPNGGYKVRNLVSKDFYSSGEITKAGLYGRDRFTPGDHKYITITEGEIDALSIYEVLKAPAVSVQSASTALRDCSLDRSYLNSYERVYIAFDGDTAGREAAKAVAKLFDYNKVFVVRFTRPDRKDANEFVQRGETDDLRNIWWNSKLFLPDTVTSSFEDFRRILSVPPKRGLSYPFPTLSKMTYGIRTGELVLLKAPEKVGKTALMRSIEHHILKETNENVGAIFLEEPQDRHLQSLGGLELKRPAHLPDSGCTTDEIIAAVEKVIGRDDRLHLFNHFGSDDPSVLLDTIRFLVVARKCVYILLDHITMLVSGLEGTDERRKLDWFITRLEMLIKELDFSLIAVSHVNDFGQTRGSHLITKVADIVIDASRDTMANDNDTKHTIRLSVPFNRYSCHTGHAGDIVLDPNTYVLTERVADGPTQISNSQERKVA